MKICKYCKAVADNDATKCKACGASDFSYKCENCGTIFESGFCPSCGVKTGAKARTCPKCGESYFSAACPRCGYTSSSSSQTYIIQSAPAVPVAHVAPKKKATGLIWLGILVPPIGTIAATFSHVMKPGWKIFLGIWCLLFSVSLFYGASEDSSLIMMPIIYCAAGCACLVKGIIEASQKRKAG